MTGAKSVGRCAQANPLKLNGSFFHIEFEGIDSISGAVRAALFAAKSFWERTISGYKPGVMLCGIKLRVVILPIDGVGGILGNGCPTLGAMRSGTLYATAGRVLLDRDDIEPRLADGTLVNLLVHEIGHAIGFGTLWTHNGLYVAGSGRYTGSHALSVYRAEFNQPDATYVPVELAGDTGTRDRHWKENSGGASNTGIVSSRVKTDLRFEIMTAWLNASRTFISTMTLRQFVDLGYTLH